MPTRKISLTPEQDAFIEQVVKASEYQNASEAVRGALRGPQQQRRHEDASKPRALRLHIKAEVEALDRGEFAEVNKPDLKSYFGRIGDRIRQWPDLTLNGAPSLTWARESRTGADSEERWGAVGTRRSAPIRRAHRNSNAPSSE
jgi:antitoxin ParD1/3/4